MTSTSPLINAAALLELATNQTVSLIDATWFLGDRSGRAAYDGGHLPGAHFFDIDAVADQSSELPHMMPSPDQFAKAAASMVHPQSDAVVVYDGSPLRSATRVWWSFKAMGANNVRILDGGLAAWQAAGGAVSTDHPEPLAGTFDANLVADRVISFDEMQGAVDDPDVLILDARPPGRFKGMDPEPRPGLSSGCMPGAVNVPFQQLYGEDGTLAPAEQLTTLFAPFDLPRYRRLIATCGSGVTACSILLALTQLGYDNTSLYDGAWAEWASRSDRIVTA